MAISNSSAAPSSQQKKISSFFAAKPSQPTTNTEAVLSSRSSNVAKRLTPFSHENDEEDSPQGVLSQRFCFYLSSC